MSDETMVSSGSRLLTIQQVAKRYGVAVRTIRRWEANDQIPRGVRLTRLTVRWREQDIEKHVLSLKA
jgi:predicted DNA-binding transcriptional regulator AlpA